MLLYFLKPIKSTESTNSNAARTKNGRIMILSKSAVCGSKKSKFNKEQEAGE